MSFVEIYELSPKHQVMAGLLPKDVKCKPAFKLLFKSSDNSTACVTPETAEKVIERNWGYR